MDTIVDMPAKRHFQKRIVFYVFAMSFGSVSFGYASAIIATTLGNVGDFDSCYCGLTEIGQPSFQKYMDLTKTNPHTATIRGAMNSLFYAGGFSELFSILGARTDLDAKRLLQQALQS